MGSTRLAALAALVLGAAVLAECGGDDDTEQGSTRLTGRGPITWATGKDSTGTYETLVKRWNAEHPRETVRITEPTKTRP